MTLTPPKPTVPKTYLYANEKPSFAYMTKLTEETALIRPWHLCLFVCFSIVITIWLENEPETKTCFR